MVPNDLDAAETPSLYWVTESIEGSPSRSYYISVPEAPTGSRTVADGVSTSGTRELTSASAAFVLGDLNKVVWCPAFPVGTIIDALIDSHTVQLSNVASETSIALAIIIGASVPLATLDPNA